MRYIIESINHATARMGAARSILERIAGAFSTIGNEYMSRQLYELGMTLEEQEKVLLEVTGRLVNDAVTASDGNVDKVLRVALDLAVANRPMAADSASTKTEPEIKIPRGPADGGTTFFPVELDDIKKK